MQTQATQTTGSVSTSFYTFRVYVKRGIEVVAFEDTDLANVEAVKAKMRAAHPDCSVREKRMQIG